MLETDKLKEAVRKINESLQIINGLGEYEADLSIHNALEDISKNLLSARTDLLMITEVEIE